MFSTTYPTPGVIFDKDLIPKNGIQKMSRRGTGCQPVMRVLTHVRRSRTKPTAASGSSISRAAARWPRLTIQIVPPDHGLDICPQVEQSLVLRVHRVAAKDHRLHL